MKVFLLVLSLLIFILVQLGVLPFVVVVLPLVPIVSTAYVYFLLLLPFLWLRRRQVRAFWKVAALLLPAIVGVGVPLVGQVAGEASVTREFGVSPAILPLPMPK